MSCLSNKTLVIKKCWSRFSLKLCENTIEPNWGLKVVHRALMDPRLYGDVTTDTRHFDALLVYLLRSTPQEQFA